MEIIVQNPTVRIDPTEKTLTLQIPSDWRVRVNEIDGKEKTFEDYNKEVRALHRLSYLQPEIGQIGKWVEDNEIVETNTLQAMNEALGITDYKQFTRPMQMRIAECLGKLGFRPNGRRNNMNLYHKIAAAPEGDN
jgi:hypothetical protein